MLSKADELRSMTTVNEQDKTAPFLSYDINNTEARQDKLAIYQFRCALQS